MPQKTGLQVDAENINGMCMQGFLYLIIRFLED